jgi:hypothetical protein
VARYACWASLLRFHTTAAVASATAAKARTIPAIAPPLNPFPPLDAGFDVGTLSGLEEVGSLRVGCICGMLKVGVDATGVNMDGALSAGAIATGDKGATGVNTNGALSAGAITTGDREATGENGGSIETTGDDTGLLMTGAVNGCPIMVGTTVVAGFAVGVVPAVGPGFMPGANVGNVATLGLRFGD